MVRNGMNIHVWNGDAWTDWMLNNLVVGGFQDVRIDMGYPNPGNQANLDHAVQRAAQLGLGLVVTFVGPSGGPVAGNADYAAQAAGQIARWRNYRPARLALEVWNEPGQAATLYAAASYGDMVSRTYDAVKAVDPNVLVLGGSVAFNDYTFAELMWRNGAAGKVDGLALHPYTYTASDVLPPRQTYDRVHSLKASLDDQRDIALAYNGFTPIWVTELAFGAHAGVDRAKFHADALDFVRVHGDVRTVIWFAHGQPAEVNANSYWTYTNINDSSTWTPQPIWTALTGLIRQGRGTV